MVAGRLKCFTKHHLSLSVGRQPWSRLLRPDAVSAVNSQRRRRVSLLGRAGAPEVFDLGNLARRMQLHDDKILD